MTMDAALRKLAKAIENEDRFARVALLESPPDGFVEAALREHPEILDEWASVLVERGTELPPELTVRCLVKFDGKGAGEWFRGWSNAVDQIFAAAFCAEPAAFAGLEPEHEVGRLGLELLRARCGDTPGLVSSDLQLKLLEHLGPNFYPQVVVTASGPTEVATDDAGTPMIAPVFGPLFGSEENFARAVRARAMPTFATERPRRDLIVWALEGATDDELAAIFSGGETLKGYELYFQPFALAVGRSGLAAERLAAIARDFEPGAHGASLAAWATLIATGAAEFPHDLDAHLDFAPCDIRTVDATGSPYGDIPAMQAALAGMDTDRLRKIIDGSTTRRPNWPEGWCSARYITAFAFMGPLVDDALFDRLLEDRMGYLDYFASKPFAERIAASNAWESASFLGQTVALRFYEWSEELNDFEGKECALAMLQTSAVVDGHVVDGVDEMLSYGVQMGVTRLATILPLLDEKRRESLLDQASDNGAYFYGQLIAEVFDPALILRLKKKPAREAALAVLEQAQGRPDLARALDASFPEVIEGLKLKLSSDEREMIEGLLGQERVLRWWPKK